MTKYIFLKDCKIIWKKGASIEISKDISLDIDDMLVKGIIAPYEEPDSKQMNYQRILHEARKGQIDKEKLKTVLFKLNVIAGGGAYKLIDEL